jgi:hypothetical protein
MKNTTENYACDYHGCRKTVDAAALSVSSWSFVRVTRHGSAGGSTESHLCDEHGETAYAFLRNIEAP